MCHVSHSGSDDEGEVLSVFESGAFRLYDMFWGFSFRCRCRTPDYDFRGSFALWASDVCEFSTCPRNDGAFEQASRCWDPTWLGRLGFQMLAFSEPSTTQDYEKMHWDVKINIFQWTPKVCEKKDRLFRRHAAQFSSMQ